MSTENASSTTFHLRGLDIGHPEVERHDAQRHETHVEVGCEHQSQGEDGTRKQWQNFDEEIVHRVAHAHDTSVYARLQLTRFVALAGEEGHAEGKDPVEHL